MKPHIGAPETARVKQPSLPTLGTPWCKAQVIRHAVRFDLQASILRLPTLGACFVAQPPAILFSIFSSTFPSGINLFHSAKGVGA